MYSDSESLFNGHKISRSKLNQNLIISSDLYVICKLDKDIEIKQQFIGYLSILSQLTITSETGNDFFLLLPYYTYRFGMQCILRFPFVAMQYFNVFCSLRFLTIIPNECQFTYKYLYIHSYIYTYISMYIIYDMHIHTLYAYVYMSGWDVHIYEGVMCKF